MDRHKTGRLLQKLLHGLRLLPDRHRRSRASGLEEEPSTDQDLTESNDQRTVQTSEFGFTEELIDSFLYADIAFRDKLLDLPKLTASIEKQLKEPDLSSKETARALLLIDVLRTVDPKKAENIMLEDGNRQVATLAAKPERHLLPATMQK